MVAVLALTAAPELPPLPEDPADRDLIVRWRERQVWLAETEGQFLGHVQGSTTLMNLGKVGFILEQIGGRARRYLPSEVHDWVFDAVEGQSPGEIETNLPAIVNFVQIATASQLYFKLAKEHKPPFGKRKGFAEIAAIARRAFEFRNEQTDRVLRGRVEQARILSATNLGDLGQPEILEELRISYRVGQDQFTGQRNLVILVVFAVELLISLFIALTFLRRADKLVRLIPHTHARG